MQNRKCKTADTGEGRREEKNWLRRRGRGGEREGGAGNKVCGQRPGSTDWKPAPRASVISQIVRSVIFCPRLPGPFPSRFLSALFYAVLSCNVPRRKMVPLLDGKRTRIVNRDGIVRGRGNGSADNSGTRDGYLSDSLWIL